jgi:hypothetical protein
MKERFLRKEETTAIRIIRIHKALLKTSVASAFVK